MHFINRGWKSALAHDSKWNDNSQGKIMQETRCIILASGSPRRLELMKRIGFLPEVCCGDVEEQMQENETPVAYTRRLAVEKAQATPVDPGEQRWILAADTIVRLEGEVLEKPVDEADAKRMLGIMSGRTHEVITSFCWFNPASGRKDIQSVIAKVEMINLSESTIDAYIATGESMDKAGAYGIQAVGATLVRKVDGSYFCVMGLPVCEVVESLKKLGGLQVFPFPPQNKSEGDAG